MNDEAKDTLKRILDGMEAERKEHIQYLKAKVRDCPGSLTDGDRLELIGQRVWDRDIEIAPYFEMLVTTLSFAEATLDPENLKTAWKEFLASCESPTLSEEWD
jgi:hypothetical protein